MQLGIRRIDELSVQGKRVLIRVDFNVPLNDDGTVGDDTRIREALPTIRYVCQQGGAVVLASHLGRPKGKVDPSLRMRPVADRLAELMQSPVAISPDCVGPEAETRASRLAMRELLVLENLRFHSGEKANDPEFAKSLARLADVYVNDAFGSSHREDASVVGVVSLFSEKGVGFLMDKEVKALSRLLRQPEKPYVVVLGGAKVSDKIGLIRSLLPRVDSIVVGGAMAYTLQAAQGVATGASLVEKDTLDEVKSMLKEASLRGVEILLPADHVIVAQVKKGASSSTTSGRKIPAGKLGVDIGPKTIDAFSSAVQKAHTVFWNGPMGVFEIEPFDRGTRAVAQAVAANAGYTIAGGGDTVAALVQCGLSEKLSHVSTGGGASLTFIENGDLPGLAALREGS
jgi:phosphoglycerate kinase